MKIYYKVLIRLDSSYNAYNVVGKDPSVTVKIVAPVMFTIDRQKTNYVIHSISGTSVSQLRGVK